MTTADPPLSTRRLARLLAILTVLGIILLGVQYHARDLRQQAAACRFHDPKKSETLARQSARWSWNDADARLLLVEALVRQGRDAEALAELDQGGFAAGHVAPLLDLAQEAQSRGRLGVARGLLLAADRPAEGERDLEVGLCLAAIEHQMLRTSDALARVEALSRQWPDEPAAWRLLASLRHESGDVAGAIAAARHALKLRPGDHALRFLLAEWLLDWGDAAAAREALAELPPGQAPPVLRARLLRAEQKPADALLILESLPTREQTPAALLLRGTVMLDLGKVEPALSPLRQAVARDPRMVEAHYKLAEAYRRLNRVAEADSHLATARQLTEARLRLLRLLSRASAEPGNEPLREQVAEAYQQLGRRGPSPRTTP